MVHVTVIEERRCASCDDKVGHHFHLIEIEGENARVCLCEACSTRLLRREGDSLHEHESA